MSASSVEDASSATGEIDSGSVYEREYQVKKGCRVRAETRVGDGGKRLVEISTDIPGKFVLHWGLQGEGGDSWRLPETRPEGTVEYKRRALQTPFQSGEDKKKVLIEIDEGDVSRYLNFVLKDTNSDTWYDFNGGNFHIPLRLDGEQKGDGSGARAHRKLEGVTRKKQMLREDDIPAIPQDLAGVWSYMKWENAGCPNRSQEDSDREYNVAMNELTVFLRQGVSLETLKSVAEQGVGRYQEFLREQEKLWNVEVGETVSDSADPPTQDFEIDQEIINLKAYLMWEDAGKPDGADFGEKARLEIMSQLDKGMSIKDVRRSLKQNDKNEATSQDIKKPEAVEEKTMEVEKHVIFSNSVGMKQRNPLDLIHRSGAPKLAEVRKRTPKPLEPLWKNAREDENCVWHRVYSLGSKSELLVSVHNDEDEVSRVVLTTDNASDVVLHWGVKKDGKSWKKPDEGILPEQTEFVEGGKAAETPFAGCDDEECHIEIGGAPVPLQRAQLSIPNNSGVSAISFVLRSEDGRYLTDCIVLLIIVRSDDSHRSYCRIKVVERWSFGLCSTFKSSSRCGVRNN